MNIDLEIEKAKVDSKETWMKDRQSVTEEKME